MNGAFNSRFHGPAGVGKTGNAAAPGKSGKPMNLRYGALSGTLQALMAFVFCSAFAAHAGEMLRWQECVAEAVRKHPDLVSAQEQIDQAGATRTAARGLLFPQVSGFVNQASSKSETTIAAEAYSYGFTLQQLLYDGFKTSYDVAAASENIRTAQYSYSAISADVRSRLRAAFVELLRAQELSAISERIAQRRRQNVELVRLRYQAGREHKGSLLTAEADAAQAEFNVAQAGRNIELAQRRLSRELGRPAFRPLRAMGDFTVAADVRESPDFEGMAKNNPLVQQRASRREAARFGLRSAEAGYFPQVFANASAGRAATAWPPDTNEWTAGLSLTLPLLDGGIRKAEVARAGSALKQAEADERSGHDGVQVTLAETWTRLRDAVERVQVQQKFLEAAEARAAIARAQYSNGLISFDTWTIIENDLVQADQTLLDARADALIAEANWIRAQGGTLEHAD